jgi:hypothetical protein
MARMPGWSKVGMSTVISLCSCPFKKRFLGRGNDGSKDECGVGEGRKQGRQTSQQKQKGSKTKRKIINEFLFSLKSSEIIRPFSNFPSYIRDKIGG